MKTNAWLVSRTCLLLCLGGAAECLGQCNPDPFRPDLRAPCPTIADQLSKAADAAKQFNNQVGEMNKDIDSTRRNLWGLYPDKPGFEAAELALYTQLRNKDMYYLMFALQGGMNDRMSRMPNVIGLLNGSVAPEDLNKFPTNVDGGIKPLAFPLFAAWVDALRRAEGRDTDGAIATPFIIATAVQDKSNWRKAYEDSRNWAEFISSGLDISKYLSPQVYILKQMETDVSMVMARSKPADLPDPVVATRGLYDLFVKAFGEKDVLAAAGAVLRIPKNSVGGLAKRADVAIGTYIQAPSPNPYLFFLTLLTNGSPRNYAIALCMDPYGMLGGEARATFNSQDKWAKAFSDYNQISAKYGEANVISAAERLKNSEKTSEGGLRADPQRKSMIFWFQTLIKDPKAVIPDAQVAHFKASSYDPHWMGKIVELRGTVSRVDMAKGFPPYATIHFKESRDDAIVGYTPNSDMLHESYGDNFSNLVGKPVEIWGEVGAWGEGAGVRIIDRDQVKVLDAATGLGANFTESRPEWLTAAIPVVKLVDSPDYLAWKKFQPGTTVTHESRVLHENTPGSNQYTRTKVSQDTVRLESIDDKRAVIIINSTSWHMNGQVTQSPERKLTYPAKKAPDPSPAAAPNESGEETLQISGKKFATHWQSVWGRHTVDSAPNPETFTKTWTSEDVPGGMVLMHKQDHREIVGKEYRNIDETILVPVQNVEPELGSSSSIKQTSGAPAAQPATPSRNIRAAETVNRPEAEAAPTTPAANASVQTALPSSRRRPDSPVTPIPALSSRAEFAKHYNLVMTRAVRAEAGLARLQRRQAASRAELPESVRTARDRLDAQLEAVASATRARDNGTAEQSLHAVEDTLTVIEQFLAK